ncbi:MAG: PSD1 and planctomycete cytochrome C domain-containing protein [Bryobacterales bacterium]|nr:PSD1 and planctomycete cytochrome C domain-containing protein [Bryobacterales bacterium]
MWAFSLVLGTGPIVASDSGDEVFALHVKPLMAAKCAACHGQNPQLILAGLDLTSRDGLLQGGQTGTPAVVPGDAEASLLYRAISGLSPELVMPPKETDRLTNEEVESFRRWIEAGAPWPSDDVVARIEAEWLAASANRVRVPTSGGQTAEWTDRLYDSSDIWAFRPVAKPTAPYAHAPTAVDAFHRARLLEVGVEPAPPADRLDLLRRATYDLTGLPPTPDQTRDFMADKSPGSWERLIDRLLASPAYGEQWGRHWLDVVRYADTAGNSNDYERSNAWRYRDYVVRAFNSDKPYDQFVIEQLAGDELRPDDPEMRIATGFLRMGPWGSAMVPKKMARQAYLDDVVHSVGQTFLSLPLRCAKCHDHKVDPIPTRDYYRIYAAFATTQMAERPAAFLPEENLARFAEGRAHVEALREFASKHKQTLEDKLEEAAQQWYADRGLEFVPEARRKDVPDDAKPPRHYGLSSAEEGRLKVRRQDEWIWVRRLERYQPMAQTVFNGPDYIPGNGRKLRVPAKLDRSWRPDSRILDGGSVHAPTEPVSPGVLSATGLPARSGSGPDEFALPGGLDGRRLALARWIVDPGNPLAARSIVNRVWAYHFGRGLAATPNNLGGLGSKPTHPQLLDWLTADFVRSGWSIKGLHRIIMGSRLYRQSTERPDMSAVREKDPENRLLAYFEPRRLAAEEFRDSMLMVSGELNGEVGGVFAKPEINMDVALQPRMIQFSIAPAYQPSPTPQERNRRAVYAYRVRGQADPLMEVFNQPSPNESCERRDASAVSTQALTMMNSSYATSRSIAFAQRLRREVPDTPGQVRLAYELAHGRPPERQVLEKVSTYLAAMEEHHRQRRPQPLQYPTRITRSLVEEFTGDPFEYEEWLPVYERYTPDLGAWDIPPATRALADFCLLLFNSNEFAYVY